MKIMECITIAFLISNTFDRYSLSELISSKDLAIQNNMALIKMKSNPYNTSASSEKDYWQQMLLNMVEWRYRN